MNMSINKLRAAVRQFANRYPRTKTALLRAQTQLGLAQHTLGTFVPQVIRPRPRKLTIAITAYCNLRCLGCRYGRDFMTGEQLQLEMVKNLLDDSKEVGIETVRLYGGEPLLHQELPNMIRHSVDLGLSTYVTTNGLLLKQKISSLFEAGLRNVTIGFYGTSDDYDMYVNRQGRFRRLEESISSVRDRYGSRVSMQLNYLLTRSSCSVAALQSAWSFATKYDLEFTIDLIHYSLPYFTDGPNHELQFRQEDNDPVKQFVTTLAELKYGHPKMIKESLTSIFSIPDWLLKGPDMRVPCDAHKLIWVGADGTVQLCYAAFPLGNLHQQRLKELLFTADHRQAARDAFALNCPRCHCEREARILKHHQSRRKYKATSTHYTASRPL
jgi:MoaA/NifB/PqqE/SkfB family radical SAM enzyme